MGSARHIERPCAWCLAPLLGTRRPDAKTCSKACRQAMHRFRVAGAGRCDASPMRFAYADPPYPGLAGKYYDCPEVDHQALVNRLVREWPDGWALSTSAASSRDVWAMCPPSTRLCVWVRGSRKSVACGSRNAWEALLVFGGRARHLSVAEDLDDVLLWGGRQHSHPDALVGMKPAAFCEWMFRQLGAVANDELTDLYPRSGAVSRAWDLYTSPPAESDASHQAAKRLPSRPPGKPLPSRLQEGQKRLMSTLDPKQTPKTPEIMILSKPD